MQFKAVTFISIQTHTHRTTRKHDPSWFETKLSWGFVIFLDSQESNEKVYAFSLTSPSPTPIPHVMCVCVSSIAKRFNESKNNSCQITLIKFKLQSIKHHCSPACTLRTRRKGGLSCLPLIGWAESAPIDMYWPGNASTNWCKSD